MENLIESGASDARAASHLSRGAASSRGLADSA